MGKFKHFRKNFNMTTIIENIYSINDLATTTGNGDVMPTSNMGIVAQIPLFYFANVNLA